ncbi:MAG: WecB/TagA/CpsF family glycosyltransferase [Anaerolineae bacterium]|jgi:N-acetylglucosaminyldiphosphoundecaprenol N-acetyl-beta-D-mannosaminyltransferase
MQLVRSIEILGVRVDDATNDDLVDRVDAFVASSQPHQIVTLNTEMVVAAHEEASLAQVLNSADLNVADGAGVMLAARLLGHPLRERVTGSDGIYRLAAHCAQQGYRPFLLGAAPGVAEVAAGRLVAANPDLEVAGVYAGSPLPEDEDDIIARVRAAEPELLLVAYGVPAEEKWIARNRQRLGVPVMIGVGGTFDFVAGMTRRAPPWMRRWGLEWLYRLLQEPWRWRRQLALPKFLALVAKQKMWGR